MTRYLPLLLLSACGGDPFTLLALPDAGPALADPSPPEAGSEHVKPADIDAPPGAPIDASTDAPADAPPETTPDAGTEASRIDASAPEAAPPPPMDAGVPDAPWVLPDAGTGALPDACTPFPSPITWAQSCDGTMATVPANFFIIQSGPCTTPTSVITSGGELSTVTPKECQCRETYSCACLDSLGVCGPGKHVTLCQPSQNANSEVVVQCG